MMKNRGIVLLAIVFFMSACAHYTLVEPAKKNMGGGYSVEPQTTWNRSVQGKIEIWTIDGPALAAVHFFNGIGDGQNLFPFYGKSTRKAKLPRFNKNMTASQNIKKRQNRSLHRFRCPKIRCCWAFVGKESRPGCCGCR